MKKRILSLLLAVCMVTAAVPALLLSVTAAENKGFTTTIRATAAEGEVSNWPSYTSGQTLDGFNGNWEVGRYREGVYARSDTFDKTYNIIHAGDGQWSETGLYLGSGDNRAILTSSEYMVKGVVAFAFAYNAMYEGTVDLGFTTLTPYVGDTAGLTGTAAVYAAVFVNDVMVWPATGASVTDVDSFATISTTDDVTNHANAGQLKNIQVNIGDRISFVVGNKNTYYANIVPFVTYHDGYAVAPSRYSQSFGPSSTTWPETCAMQGTGALAQIDTSWSLGGYDAAAKTFAAYKYQHRNSNFGVWVDNIEDQSKAVLAANNGIVLSHNNGKVTGAYLFGSSTTDSQPAFRTTSVATAKASFTAGSTLLAKKDQTALKNVSAAVDVYVNGELKGTITLKSDAKGAVTVTSVDGIDVKKGDEIIFTAKKVDDSVTYLLATPQINFTEIKSFIPGEVTDKYAVAADEAKVVVTNGKIGLQFNAYATIDVYSDATAANVYVWDASVTGEKTLANATAVLPMSVDTKFAYTATYNGFAPKEMTDTITAQIVILKGEETLCSSDPATFTVAETAQKQYDAAVNDADERALMAAVMNYGAYAQKYFKYNTDNLANKGLSANAATIDIDKYQYFSDFTGERGGHTDALLTYTDLTAFSLYIENTISIRFYLNVNEWEKNNAVDMYIRYGDEETYVDKDAPKLTIDRENGSALLEGLTLNQLEQVFYLQVASQEYTSVAGKKRLYTYYGYIWQYSVESFAARMMDSTEANLPELLCAMMELSKLAK